LLLFIVFKPFFSKSKPDIYNHSPHSLKLKIGTSGVFAKKNIAVSVDFSKADEGALNNAFALGGDQANYTLIHVVETVGAMMYGDSIEDHETSIDEKLLAEYKEILTLKGYKATTQLAFGEPAVMIPKIVNAGSFDLLVMGTHGHTGFKDLIFGTTIDKVRHKIKIPLYLIKH
jgi:manganese transport protein